MDWFSLDKRADSFSGPTGSGEWEVPGLSGRELRFSASARLALWDTYEGDRQSFLRKLSGILQEHSHGSIEFREGEPSVTENETLLSLANILDQIVSRGNPTLTHLHLEEQLLDSPGLENFTATDLAEEDGHRRVGKKLISPGNNFSLDSLAETARRQFASPWSDDLLQTQLEQPSDYALQDLSSTEDDLFFSVFGEVFGKGAQRLMRRKQPLMELIPSSSGPMDTYRVDFAFQFGPIRWIFEIDEEQFSSNVLRREELDQQDALLEEHGWEVHRFTAEEIRGDLTHRLTLLRNTLPSALGDSIRALSENDLSKQKDGPAYTAILIPHIIQKILRALVHLLRYGAIPASGKAKILVVEEEEALTPEAFRILLDLWEHLRILAPSINKPPEITLDIIGQRRFGDPEHEHIQVRYLSSPHKKYDLIISQSFTLFSGQRGVHEHQILEKTEGPVVEIRNARIHREHRELEPAPPLEYDLTELLGPGNLEEPDEEENPPLSQYQAMQFLLRNLFRKYDFWEGQITAIARLLQGANTTVLLPSGGGKSLIYQYAGLLLPGFTLIVDPSAALMRDQIDNLSDLGFDRTGYVADAAGNLHSSLMPENISDGRYSYLFVSPEVLLTHTFKDQLRGITHTTPLTLAVVDEAHCLSEWSHDFRPAYSTIGRTIRKYGTPEQGTIPTIVGLTGTASFHVLTDIQAELETTGSGAVIQAESLDREELVNHVERADTIEKERKLQTIRKSLPSVLKKNPQRFFEPRGDQTISGLIYSAEEIAEEPLQLASQLGHRQWYSETIPGSRTYPETDWRQQNVQSQRRFKQNAVQELVASPGFGIGIDKENVRYTIHYTMPDSVEAFYQEAGRAGRSGRPASAHNFILYNDSNWELAEELADRRDHEEALEKLQSLNGTRSGDFLLQLENLYNVYPGAGVEKEFILRVWEELGTHAEDTAASEHSDVQELAFRNSGDRKQIERALHRLMVLGVVEEYSLVPEEQQIRVYLSGVSPDNLAGHLRTYLSRFKFDDFVEDIIHPLHETGKSELMDHAITGLTTFIYDEIVEEKVRSLHHMATLCRNYESDEEFRRHILDYLRESRFASTLRSWVESPFDKVGVRSVEQILEQVESRGEAQRLAGSCERLLENDAGNIALRLTLCGAKMRSSLESDDQVSDESFAFIDLIRQQYKNLRNPESVLLAMFGELVQWRNHLVDDLLDTALRKIGTLQFIRGFLEHYRDDASEANRQSMITITSAEGLMNAVDTGFYQSLTEGV